MVFISSTTDENALSCSNGPTENKQLVTGKRISPCDSLQGAATNTLPIYFESLTTTAVTIINRQHFWSGKSSFSRTPRHTCPFDKNTARPTEFPHCSRLELERVSITAPIIIH